MVTGRVPEEFTVKVIDFGLANTLPPTPPHQTSRFLRSGVDSSARRTLPLLSSSKIGQSTRARTFIRWG